MQYILTEQEMNTGCELIEAWSTKIPVEQIVDRQEELHKQGYFTCVVYYTDDIPELKVYQKYYEK